MVQLYENGVGHLYLLIFIDIHIIPGCLKGYQYLLAIIVSMQLLLISKKVMIRGWGFVEMVQKLWVYFEKLFLTLPHYVLHSYIA